MMTSWLIAKRERIRLSRQQPRHVLISPQRAPYSATFKVAAKPTEPGSSADEVREFDLRPELKVLVTQEVALAVAEAAAAAESSDEGVVVKAAVAAKRQWSCNGVESVDRWWGVPRGSLAELSK